MKSENFCDVGKIQMTKPEFRRNAETRMTKSEFVIRISSFVICSDFGFRHSGLYSPGSGTFGMLTSRGRTLR